MSETTSADTLSDNIGQIVAGLVIACIAGFSLSIFVFGALMSLLAQFPQLTGDLFSGFAPAFWDYLFQVLTENPSVVVVMVLSWVLTAALSVHLYTSRAQAA